MQVSLKTSSTMRKVVMSLTENASESVGAINTQQRKWWWSVDATEIGAPVHRNCSQSRAGL